MLAAAEGRHGGGAGPQGRGLSAQQGVQGLPHEVSAARGSLPAVAPSSASGGLTPAFPGRAVATGVSSPNSSTRCPPLSRGTRGGGCGRAVSLDLYQARPRRWLRGARRKRGRAKPAWRCLMWVAGVAARHPVACGGCRGCKPPDPPRRNRA